MDLTILNSMNLDDCGKSILTLSANGDCNTSEISPGKGKLIAEREIVTPAYYDPYKKSINVRACITRIPREITRQISFNCRTQKVESSVKYSIQGYDVFTPEKMDEIELLFHGRDIYVNGIKVVFSGGTVFEPISKGLPNEYKLNVEVEECPKRIVYGCGDGGNCAPIVTKFIIPDRIITPTFFDSHSTKIAIDYSGLLDYYRVQPDIARVTDITGSVSIPCSFYKVFEVESIGDAPDYFYFDQPRPLNKVYGKIVDNDTELCAGLPANPTVSGCDAPDLGAPVVVDTTCTAPTLGTPIVNSKACEIVISNDWLQGNEITSLDNESGVYSLKLSLKKTLPIPSLETVVFAATGDKVCYWQANDFLGKSVYDIESVKVDGIEIADTLFIFDGEDIGSITFVDPCVTPVDSIVVTFRTGESSTPSINETVAVVGADCRPSITRIFTHSDDDGIPEDATVTINTLGQVIYNGVLDTAGTDALILLTNIQYT